MRAAAQWVIVGFGVLLFAALLPAPYNTVLAAGAALLLLVSLLECFFWDEPMVRHVTLRIRINRPCGGDRWAIWLQAGGALPLETILPAGQREFQATFPLNETCKLRVRDETLAGAVVGVYNKVFLTGYNPPHCGKTDPILLELVEA